MTADAKVGLLLGLFFIVLIAFLINGLPNFLQETESKDGVKTAIVAPSGPDLVIDHRVTETAQRLLPSIPLRVTESPQEVIVLSQTPQSDNTVVAVEPPQPLQPTAAPAIVEQVNQLPLPQPPTAQKPGSENSRIHVVQKGESLASIAQKYYGKEEGNRRAAIDRLYEANKDILSSPDKVAAGHKLTIPGVPAETAVKKPSASETLLQKFSHVLERTPTPPPTTAPAAAEPKPAMVKTPAPVKTAEYIVQPGDTLWKIAEKTLGDGRKYHTLIELNKDRLKNPDDVVVGMKLAVPKN